MLQYTSCTRRYTTPRLNVPSLTALHRRVPHSTPHYRTRCAMPLHTCLHATPHARRRTEPSSEIGVVSGLELGGVRGGGRGRRHHTNSPPPHRHSARPRRTCERLVNHNTYYLGVRCHPINPGRPAGRVSLNEATEMPNSQKAAGVREGGGGRTRLAHPGPGLSSRELLVLHVQERDLYKKTNTRKERTNCSNSINEICVFCLVTLERHII
ncbi:hypothetical protein E2C01_075571 [Portunus trituberculatus]|uniref:Uncharacterized protein n=1 Tax=Portunus trituberculatus TaxID=210409 RepID=A0A5B7I6F5_PORTR|nr:hypothetical protein [Portunus trituberculatus]